MPKNNTALPTLISVFFFWGFVAASNTVLIGIFKDNFSLSQFQSQLVDLAFYGAYFLGSLVYFSWSKWQGDPLNKIGYKKGLSVGLVISALGSACFIPAANLASYPLMLGGLFVVGLGFALQQIVANPFVIALGSPSTGAHRNNLAGAVNSLGTTIGPLLVSYAIFGVIVSNAAVTFDITKVRIPYTILAVAFLLVAGLIYYSKLPDIKTETDTTKGLGALQFPQLIWGMVGIFFYVGTEVTIQSNLPALGKQIAGLNTQDVVHLISLYWGCLMVGRWAGALTVFNLSKLGYNLLLTGVPLLAYGLIVLVNWIKGSPLIDFLCFSPFVLFAILMFYLSGNKPIRTTILFTLSGMACMLGGLLLDGLSAVYFFIAGGLFCSVLWPCIFSLSIAGLGKYTTQGSSLLIMMILGGAVLPPVQGLFADAIDIQSSYIVPMLGFGVLCLYGFRVGASLKKQGINYDAEL